MTKFAPLPATVIDNARVRLGAGLRIASISAPIPAAVRDTGRVRLGAGLRRV